MVNSAKATAQGNHYSRPICLLATLDVKNAFNSVMWDKALDAFERDFQIPEYLLRILGDYLKDRSIVYDTTDGPIKREITSGAIQGSMLVRTYGMSPTTGSCSWKCPRARSWLGMRTT